MKGLNCFHSTFIQRLFLLRLSFISFYIKPIRKSLIALCKVVEKSIGKIKMKILLAVLFLFVSQVGNTQHLDRQQLDAHLKKIDTAGNLAKGQVQYIINGIPFSRTDSLRLDSALLSYTLHHLISLEVLTAANLQLAHSNSPVVLIRFAYQQPGKEKKAIWRKAAGAFSDQYVSFSQHIFTNAKDPVLYINNEKIHHTATRDSIRSLSARSIYYIEYKPEPVSPELYGQNAKNGLVRIWTGKN